jgi:hypothetical protein
VDQLQVFGTVVLATDILERRFLRDTLRRLGSRTLPFCRICWSLAILAELANRLRAKGWAAQRSDELLKALSQPADDDLSNLVPASDEVLRQLSSSVPDKAGLATAITAESKVIISTSTFPADDVLDISIYNPDAFLMYCWKEISSADFEAVLIATVAHYRERTFAEYLDGLGRQSCPQLALSLADQSKGGHDLGLWEYHVNNARRDLTLQRPELR